MCQTPEVGPPEFESGEYLVLGPNRLSSRLMVLECPLMMIMVAMVGTDTQDSLNKSMCSRSLGDICSCMCVSQHAVGG